MQIPIYLKAIREKKDDSTFSKVTSSLFIKYFFERGCFQNALLRIFFLLFFNALYLDIERYVRLNKETGVAKEWRLHVLIGHERSN